MDVTHYMVLSNLDGSDFSFFLRKANYPSLISLMLHLDHSQYTKFFVSFFRYLPVIWMLLNFLGHCIRLKFSCGGEKNLSKLVYAQYFRATLLLTIFQEVLETNNQLGCTGTQLGCWQVRTPTGNAVDPMQVLSYFFPILFFFFFFPHEVSELSTLKQYFKTIILAESYYVHSDTRVPVWQLSIQDLLE